MEIQSLGHVVIKVRDQERSEAFYNGILGLPIAARMERLAMTFFSLGNHHDFAIAAIGDDAETAPRNAPGLAHVAFCIGDTLEQLQDAKSHLEASGLSVRPVNHGVSHSLYFADPDGNQVEVYVDANDDWKKDPSLVAFSEPMEV